MALPLPPASGPLEGCRDPACWLLLQHGRATSPLHRLSLMGLPDISRHQLDPRADTEVRCKLAAPQPKASRHGF